MDKKSENGNLALNFALIEPRLPKTLEEINDNPLAYGEYLRLTALWEKFNVLTTDRDERGFVAKQLRAIFGAGGANSSLYDTLIFAFRKAHDFIDWLVKEWLPESYHSNFSSDGIVRSTVKFSELLRYWKNYLNQADSLSMQREFEVRRTILLGFIFFELFSLEKDVRRCGKIQVTLTEYLEHEFFKDKITVTKYVTFFQDPKDNNRIKYYYLAEESKKIPAEYLKLVRNNKRFLCRVFQWKGKDYPVYFEVREKNDFSYVLKLFRQRERAPENTFDQIGFRLIFFSEEALQAALEKLRVAVFPLPGTSWKYHDSLSGAVKGVARNEKSCPEWRVLKFVTRCSGYWVEGMLELISDHLNATLSTGNAHHNLYKLEILLENVFPLLFPSIIYGIDWKSEDVRRDLWNFHKAKIK